MALNLMAEHSALGMKTRELAAAMLRTNQQPSRSPRTRSKIRKDGGAQSETVDDDMDEEVDWTEILHG